MTLSLKNPPGNPSSSIGINRDLMKIQTVTKNKLLKSDEGMDGTANLLQIEQKFVAMMLISSFVSQPILRKLGRNNLSGSESNLAKLEFENSERLPW